MLQIIIVSIVIKLVNTADDEEQKMNKFSDQNMRVYSFFPWFSCVMGKNYSIIYIVIVHGKKKVSMRFDLQNDINIT